MSDVKNQLVDYVKDSFIQQEIMAMKKYLTHKSYDQLMNELLFLKNIGKNGVLPIIEIFYPPFKIRSRIL